MPDQQPFNPEFVNNPEPRVPCILVLDTSGSMHGARIDELNAGVAVCKSELLADPIAAKRVELAVLTFGGVVTVAHEFSTVDNFQPQQFVADGGTPLGAAANRAIDMVNERKQTYKQAGVAYYRPWIFLITDGAPTDRWDDAAHRIQEGERQNNFVFYSVAVQEADIGVLKQLSKRTEPLKLKGLAFHDLFQWLSSSLSNVSKSQPTDPVALQNPTAGPKGWAEIPAGV
jgi:uncharacterized protein YegL